MPLTATGDPRLVMRVAACTAGAAAAKMRMALRERMVLFIDADGMVVR